LEKKVEEEEEEKEEENKRTWSLDLGLRLQLILAFEQDAAIVEDIHNSCFDVLWLEVR
jgi:hypothetical protein